MNYIRVLQKKIDRSDHIVFISNFSRDDANKYLRFDKNKTSVIYNGASFVKGNSEAPIFRKKITGKFLFNINKLLQK